MLLHRGIDSIIVTSSDQRGEENIYPVVPKWNVAAVVPLLRTLKQRGVTSVLFHYPSARFGRSISLVLIPLLLRAAGIRTTLYLHEYADYSFLGKVRTILMTVFVHGVIAADTPNLAGIRKVFPWKQIVLLSAGATIVLPDAARAAYEDDDSVSRGGTSGKKNIFFSGTEKGSSISWKRSKPIRRCSNGPRSIW
jgi:hypothetical protein